MVNRHESLSEAIPGFKLIHKQDGHILFIDSGSSAVSAWIALTVEKTTLDEVAAEFQTSVQAVQEAVKYCESGQFDYAANREMLKNKI